MRTNINPNHDKGAIMQTSFAYAGNEYMAIFFLALQPIRRSESVWKIMDERFGAVGCRP
jgi:hypothetical protein